ncbi:MAG: CDP-glycerol glycerophosphotransferase family protein [Merdibacter sp.]
MCPLWHAADHVCHPGIAGIPGGAGHGRDAVYGCGLPPAVLKRSGQRCIATWHGTPLKTLGFDYMADEYVVGNQKRGFTLADLLIMPNVYTWERIEHSYQLEGMVHARIVYGGSPRNSVFFDEERRNALRHSLGVADKRVIAYLPTWRGKVIDVDARAQSEQLQDLLEEIDDRLDDDMVLWAKLHRLNHQQLQLGHLRHIVAFPQGLDTYDVLTQRVLVTLLQRAV